MTLIPVLYIVDFENMKHATFQIHWSIILRDIYFLINLKY